MDAAGRCRKFLSETAVGKWYDTPRFKNSSDGYLHPVSPSMVLLRLEGTKYRRFYWLYDTSDAIRFNAFVSDVIHAELHEIIIGKHCRLFYDIDLKLDADQQEELADHYGLELTEETKPFMMDIVGKNIAKIYAEATILSLEESGNDRDEDLSGFDWMFCMRNRACGDGFKISIHIITNLFIQLNACKAIAGDVKNNILRENLDLLQITDTISYYLESAIDANQYRSRGSLGMPTGCKRVDDTFYQNHIYKEYGIPGQKYLITIPDKFSLKDIILDGFNLAEADYVPQALDSDFAKNALKHVSKISDYDARAFDIRSSSIAKCRMYVKRYSPSYCSICKRTHDNDNTLIIIFNSSRRVASWKCAHADSMIPIIFYQEEDTKCDDSELDAFARKFKTINGGSRSIYRKRTSAPVVLNTHCSDEEIKRYHNIEEYEHEEERLSDESAVNMLDPESPQPCDVDTVDIRLEEDVADVAHSKSVLVHDIISSSTCDSSTDTISIEEVDDDESPGQAKKDIHGIDDIPPVSSVDIDYSAIPSDSESADSEDDY